MEIEISERFRVETFCLKCILAVQKRDWKKSFFLLISAAHKVFYNNNFFKTEFSPPIYYQNLKI